MSEQQPSMMSSEERAFVRIAILQISLAAIIHKFGLTDLVESALQEKKGILPNSTSAGARITKNREHVDMVQAEIDYFVQLISQEQTPPLPPES